MDVGTKYHPINAMNRNALPCSSMHSFISAFGADHCYARPWNPEICKPSLSAGPGFAHLLILVSGYEEASTALLVDLEKASINGCPAINGHFCHIPSNGYSSAKPRMCSSLSPVNFINLNAVTQSAALTFPSLWPGSTSRSRILAMP